MSDSEDLIDDDSDIFIVECILAESWDEEKACPIYLIKWDGYDLYESTWETQASFEQGADDVLSNWEEVKKKRRNGDLEDFDVATFEVRRHKWLQRLKRKRNQETTTSSLPPKLLHGANVDDGSSSEAEEDSSLPREPQARSGRSSKGVARSSNPDQVQTKDNFVGSDVNRSTAKHRSERYTMTGMKRTISSGSSSPNFGRTHVGATVYEGLNTIQMESKNLAEGQKLSSVQKSMPVTTKSGLGSVEPYKARDKVFTMAKLNAELKKKKFKIKSDAGLDNEDKYVKQIVLVPPEPTPEISQPAMPDSETKPLRVLPKTLKAAREAKSRAQDTALMPSDTKHLDGMLFVSDSVAVEPAMLYTLLKKVRGFHWKFMISKLAYDNVQSQDNKLLTKDYQTLRDKDKICLAEKSNMIQVAAQERVRNVATCRRFVVIGAEGVPFPFVPTGIETSTPSAFNLEAAPGPSLS